MVKSQDTKSIHRNPLHSYILKTKKSQKEIKEAIPLTIATKRLKPLRINLPKETKHLCSENYKTLMEEIETTKRDGGIYHVLGLKELIL